MTTKRHYPVKSRIGGWLGAFMILSTLLLGGCSGGGKDATVTQPLATAATVTGGLLKLGAVGTTTDLIAGMDLLVNLPSGVTVDADPVSGETASGAVTVSGAAAGSNSLAVAKYAPAAASAPATLHLVMVNAAGLHPGEFVTVRFNQPAGVSLPALNAFAIASFSAKGVDGSTLSGISAVPLSVAGTDKAAASKQVRSQLVVTGDQNFLNISIDTPTKNTSQTITGTLFPGDSLTISTNTTATVTAPVIVFGKWSAQVDGLVEGPNVIAVTETDPLGAIVASVSATIYLDTKAPDLAFNFVLFNEILKELYFTTSRSFLAIGGTVDDPPYHIIAEFTVDCPTATVLMATAAVPDWQAMITDLSYGDNVCHVTAVDQAGNSTRKDVHIYFDNIAPVLDFFYFDNFVKYGYPYTLTGTVDSGVTPSVTVNGAPYTGTMTVSGTTWSCVLSGLTEGANTITMTATDAAGNVATKTATITAVTAYGSFSGLQQPSVADALKALRYAVGLDVPTKLDLLYGDLYADNIIDLADAILILEKCVGL